MPARYNEAMRFAVLLGVLCFAGCASPPPPAFSLDVESAAAQAKREGRPLIVLSVVGELDGRL